MEGLLREVGSEVDWEVLSREGGEALIETVKLSLSCNPRDVITQ